MALMFRRLTAVLLMLSWSAWGEPSLPKKMDGIVCSLAPSQSTLVASISGALGGAGATAAGIAQAAGLSVVSHSSGALILTGSSGYVGGTLGGAALAGPVK